MYTPIRNFHTLTNLKFCTHWDGPCAVSSTGEDKASDLAHSPGSVADGYSNWSVAARPAATDTQRQTTAAQQRCCLLMVILKHCHSLSLVLTTCFMIHEWELAHCNWTLLLHDFHWGNIRKTSKLIWTRYWRHAENCTYTVWNLECLITVSSTFHDLSYILTGR